MNLLTQDHRLSTLTAEELANPSLVLKRFCEDYKPSELREYISQMVEVCLTTDNTEFSQPEERGDLLTRSRDIVKALEVAYLLATPKEGEKK